MKQNNQTYTPQNATSSFDLTTEIDLIKMWDHSIDIDYENGKITCTSCGMEEEMPELPGELRDFHEILFRMHILGTFRASDCGSLIEKLIEEKEKMDRDNYGPNPVPNPHPRPNDDPGLHGRIYWSNDKPAVTIGDSVNEKELKDSLSKLQNSRKI
jgi:hypothetical protein